RTADAYGVGCEGGPAGTLAGSLTASLTASLTRAVRAAVLGRRFTIPFRGIHTISYVEDRARAFIAAARTEVPSALALRAPASEVSVEEFIGALEEAVPECTGRILTGGYPRESVPIAPVLEDAIADGPGWEEVPGGRPPA